MFLFYTLKILKYRYLKSTLVIYRVQINLLVGTYVILSQSQKWNIK